MEKRNLEQRYAIKSLCKTKTETIKKNKKAFNNW